MQLSKVMRRYGNFSSICPAVAKYVVLWKEIMRKSLKKELKVIPLKKNVNLH